jgi:hypothetical protein
MSSARVSTNRWEYRSLPPPGVDEFFESVSPALAKPKLMNRSGGTAQSCMYSCGVYGPRLLAFSGQPKLRDAILAPMIITSGKSVAKRLAQLPYRLARALQDI